MIANAPIFNFKWNFPKRHNNLVSKPHRLSNNCWWISWWNGFPMGNTDVLISHGNGVTPSPVRQTPVGNTTGFLPVCLIHCKPTFPDCALDNDLATKTDRANQQDSSWKPSNYSWHIQDFPISCHTFWNLIAIMAPTWATQGTSGSFPKLLPTGHELPRVPQGAMAEPGVRSYESCWLFHLGKLKTHFFYFPELKIFPFSF